MIEGVPLVCNAELTTFTICSIRCPSISNTFHPNDLHLSPTFHLAAFFHISDISSPINSSSIGITLSVYSFYLMKLTYTKTLRLSNLNFDEARADPHICPSSEPQPPSIV